MKYFYGIAFFSARNIGGEDAVMERSLPPNVGAW